MEGFGITDKGKVRQENQDRFIIRILDEDSAAVVLCDGMGGAQAGSVASTMAADAFATHVTECLSLPDDTRDISEIAVDAVNYANIKVYDRSFADFGCIGMGTTWWPPSSRRTVGVVNVGDSRCYLVSKGT
jgi:protein phosphatase